MIRRHQFVPPEFSEARLHGTDIAAQIADGTGHTLALLTNIAALDQQKNYTDALIQVSKAVVDNKENEQNAVRLSSQLEIMATVAPNIVPEKSRQIALEAISNEIGLVSHLLKYNGYLAELFEILKLKFSKGEVQLNGHIQDTISKMNEEARTINESNEKFNSLMAEFDSVARH